MKLDLKKYLSDIEYSIILIEKFIMEYNFSQYLNDLKTKSAVERHLGIIGEAVNNFRKAENKELKHSKQNSGGVTPSLSSLLFAPYSSFIFHPSSLPVTQHSSEAPQESLWERAFGTLYPNS
jgi:hypothetical protein